MSLWLGQLGNHASRMTINLIELDWLNYHMKDKRDKAYEKIQEELDIPITEIKNKIIGLRSQLSREVAKSLLLEISTCFDKTCFKMFYAVWPLCKTSAYFNLKYV